MVWLLIVVILLVAVGPLLWLRPTPRERRLAGLRTQARQDGLRVEMRRYPKLDLAPEDRVTAGGRPLSPELEAAVYLQPLPERLRRLPGWRVLRGDDGLAAWPGWVFELGRKPDHPALREALAAIADLIDTLPGDVVALECEPIALGAYWLERPGSTAAEVTALAGWLRAAADRIAGLDRALAGPDT